MFSRYVSPWLTLVDEAKFQRTVDRIEALEPQVIVGCHTPVIGPGLVGDAIAATRLAPVGGRAAPARPVGARRHHRRPRAGGLKARLWADPRRPARGDGQRSTSGTVNAGGSSRSITCSGLPVNGGDREEPVHGRPLGGTRHASRYAWSIWCWLKRLPKPVRRTSGLFTFSGATLIGIVEPTPGAIEATSLTPGIQGVTLTQTRTPASSRSWTSSSRSAGVGALVPAWRRLSIERRQRDRHVAIALEEEVDVSPDGQALGHDPDRPAELCELVENDAGDA